MVEIVTSCSAVACYQSCPRKRFWLYEAENGTPTRGWERRKLTIPLVTGIFVHRGLELALQGSSPSDAARQAREGYLGEVTSRGLAVEEGTDEGLIVEEQAALVEAQVYAWCRVRLPKIREEFEIVEIEQEDRFPLSDDVTLAVRQDVIERRKYDHRLFIRNFKTVGQPDDRWMKSWEVDMQLMTELLAAERRHGQQFGGVIIEGLIKGQRVGVDQWLKETKGDKEKTHHYITRSKLLYGYKFDGDPPLAPKQYDWAGTTKKGWYKFPVWKENFGQPAGMSAIEYWVDWLPEEVLEGEFVQVPPIMRANQEQIDSKIRQIVTQERKIAAASGFGELVQIATREHLDEHFPQHEGECYWPSQCPAFHFCWTENVAEDPAGSGLYQPRIDHHSPVKENV